METLKKLLAKLVGSRKAMAAFAGMLVIGAKALGFEIDPETVREILFMLGTFIVGQGIADAGAAGGSQGD